ncbi:MAG: ABC transporter permease subunit [Lachnospiraceae bacterium]|nr:ABC transporter permease subunit [Lachnospiraceae bacterium]
MKKLLLNRANLVFIIDLLLIFFMPTSQDIDAPWAFVVVLILAETLFLIQYGRSGKKSAVDVAFIAFLFLGLWEALKKLGLMHPVLVPPPENVFNVFVTQRELILQGIGSSLLLLLYGVGIALILGVVFGLLVGWIPRLREAVMPIANVISPIPPLVYTPYVVAVMPTFKLASIFVIFSAVFWPTFQQMVGRVSSMDQKIIQSAKVMNVSTPTMLFKVILPYCLPGIITGLSGSMRAAFLCLTGAELLGASSGLGFFVKKFSDYADYTKVITGIIVMGIVVTVIEILIKVLEKKCIKWKYN